MAISSTIIQFQLELSDVDRNRYEKIRMRIARHPSETNGFLLCRFIAYCLHYDEGMFFSKGICAPEEPAVGCKSEDGRIREWIEVGVPSIDRIKKAVRLADQVRVYSYRPVDFLRQSARKEAKVEEWGVEIVELPKDFIEKVEEHLQRKNDWQLVRTDDTIYLTVESGSCIEQPLIRSILGRP